MVANIDLQNIKSASQKDFHKRVATWLQTNRIQYNSRRHLLTVQGHRALNSPFTYIGADDQAGPNYTGQEVVDSYYED